MTHLVSPAVCIVSFRRPELLQRCLDSVMRHLRGAPVHILDNASDDSGAVRELARHWPDVHWTFSATNLGFAAAVNELAKQCAPHDLLLLNPDAELVGGIDETLRLAVGERVAAVAPELETPESVTRVRSWDPAHKRPTMIRSMVANAGYAHLLRGTPLSDLYRRRPSTVSGYLTGACLLITRRAWDDVGCLNEEFYLYGEEVDWQQRARARGWSLHLARERTSPSVRHMAGGTTAGSAALRSRSDDLRVANEALVLEKLSSRFRSELFLAATSVLNRVQRSKGEPAGGINDPGRRRVVITSNTLGYGGAERQRVILASALSARGFAVTVVCLQRLGPLIKELAPAVRLLRRPWWLPDVDGGAGAVLITGTTNTEAGFGTLWRALGRRRRWLVAAHTPPEPDGPTYGRRLARWMSRSDGFIALGETHWAELTRFQYLHDTVHVVPNGVSAGTALSYTPRTPLRMVVLGRVTAAKNQSGLIRALSGITDGNWDLTVYGDGPERRTLESTVPPEMRSRVHWAGWATGPDEAFRDADVLCVPSTREALPLVVLEAMARGIPVIASAVCCVPEILADGECGILVPSSDQHEWEKALRGVLEDPRMLAGSADKARARWARHYTTAQMVDHYVRLIEMSASESGSLKPPASP